MRRPGLKGVDLLFCASRNITTKIYRIMSSDILGPWPRVSSGTSRDDTLSCSCMCMGSSKRRACTANRCSGRTSNCRIHDQAASCIFDPAAQKYILQHLIAIDSPTLHRLSLSINHPSTRKHRRALMSLNQFTLHRTRQSSPHHSCHQHTYTHPISYILIISFDASHPRSQVYYCCTTTRPHST